MENIDSLRIPDEVVKEIEVSWSSMAEPAHGDRFGPNFLGINATNPNMYEEEEVSLLS